MGFGDQLRRYRELNKLTQKQLAKKSKLSEFQISRLETETHYPGLKTMERLAKALRVDVKDLL